MPGKQRLEKHKGPGPARAAATDPRHYGQQNQLQHGSRASPSQAVGNGLLSASKVQVSAACQHSLASMISQPTWLSVGCCAEAGVYAGAGAGKAGKVGKPGKASSAPADKLDSLVAQHKDKLARSTAANVSAKASLRHWYD